MSSALHKRTKTISKHKVGAVQAEGGAALTVSVVLLHASFSKGKQLP